MYLGFKFGLGYYGMEIPSEGGEDAVPCSSSDSGEEKEVPEIHACQSGWDADKVTDAWDKAACNGGYLSVFVEVFLAFFHFFLIEETHLSPFAVCETIDDRATEILSCYVIDCGSEVSAKGGEEYYEPDIEVPSCCVVGCRGDNEL